MLGEAEAEAVAACVRGGWVSSAGPDIARFEQALAAVTGSPHVVAVASGTAGLHLSFLVAGVEPNDEVLVPALTFAATANAIAHAGAVPHFIEVAGDTLAADPALLRPYLAKIAERRGSRLVNRQSGRRIAALAVVHPFGFVAPMPALLAVAAEFGVMVIEDAAEALGATLDGRAAGTFAALGVLSFNGNKIITTGSGGAILSSDGALSQRARHLSTTAKLPHTWRYDHDMVGYNYRLPNLNAALGVAQLARLADFVAAKRALIARYVEAFAGQPGVSMLPEPAGVRGNAWLATLLLDGGSPTLLDEVLAACHEAGFLCRPAWTPLHQLPMYQACPRMALPETERLAASIINLPSGPALALAVCG
jgi:perosamine synthetase